MIYFKKMKRGNWKAFSKDGLYTITHCADNSIFSAYIKLKDILFIL
jgi:hypothetical protein